MEIRYSESAGDTPAWPLIVEGVNALTQEGLVTGRGNFPVSWSNEVLYAVSDDGDIVGVICFSLQEAENQYRVTLGYVEPSSRGLGIYRKLWRELLSMSKSAHVTRVVGEVHVDNEKMHKVAASFECRLTTLVYAFDVG